MKNKITFKDDYYNDLVRQNIIMYKDLQNLTNEKLSEILNYSLNYISQIISVKVNVNCPLPLLGKIANFFSVPISNFFIIHKEIPNNLVSLTPDYVENFKNTNYNENYYYEIIRKNIKRYRKFYKKTQKELSILIGHNESYISKIESPKRSLTLNVSTIGRIADVLNIPITKLFEE